MSAKKNSRRLFSLEMSGGVDITSHPGNVARGRASYMKNLIFDGGVSRKRKGMHQVFSFLDTDDAPLKINGIHTYIAEGDEHMLIHAGCRFYRENGQIIPSDVEITDTLSCVFQLDRKMYIVGCGGFFVYDGEKISAVVPYIPTMYTGYDISLEADSVGERRNLLTPFARALYCGRLSKENTSPFFRFPSDISKAEGMTVYATISELNNNMYACTGDVRDPDKDIKVDGPVTAKFTLSRKDTSHGTEVECEDIIYKGGRVYILNADSSVSPFSVPTLYISRSGRTFNFNFNPQAECPEDMNITIEYRLTGNGDSPVPLCSFGEVIQDNRGQSRLVLSGNQSCPSRIFFSDGVSGKGPLYFPEDCAVYVDRDTPVTAFLKLSKTYLGVFKRDKFLRYAFYHYPEAKNPEERYYINGYEGRDAQGCVNPYVCGRGGSDLLVYDGKGVWGIEEVGLETDKTYLSERSRNVRRGLMSHTESEIMNARACMHEGKYYLFIGDKVYIADTGRAFLDKSLSSHSQYEWWLWEGISARCVGVFKEKMYIGDANGRIFTQGDDFRDIRIIKKTRNGDVYYSQDEGLFTLNPSIIPDEHTFVKMSGECSFLENGEFSAFIHTSAGKTRTVILPNHPSPRTNPLPRVKIMLTDGGSLECALTLYGDDEALMTFSLLSDTGELISISPDAIESVRIIETGAREYSLRRFGNSFATYDGDEAVYWYSLPASPTLTVYSYTNVECIYASPIFDLDMPMSLKTLYRIGISGESDCGGTASFGYETEKDTHSVKKTDGGFDLKSLDLSAVSFAFPMGKTYERKVLERNFSNILFFYKSSDPYDCCIRGIYALYTDH